MYVKTYGIVINVLIEVILMASCGLLYQVKEVRKYLFIGLSNSTMCVCHNVVFLSPTITLFIIKKNYLASLYKGTRTAL